MANVVVRKVMTPGLIAFVASQRLRNHPYGLYRTGQRIDPIHLSSIGVWVVMSHAGVSMALREPRLGNDERKADTSLVNFGIFDRLVSRSGGGRRETSPFLGLFNELMLFRDPPDHTRLRALVAKAFTPRRVEALSARIQELTDEILDAASHHGRMDLMRELAYPLPARVICELIGVPHDDVPLVVKHAPALAVGLDPSPMRPREAIERADRSTLELMGYISGLISERRRSPSDDMLSALIAAEEDGETLSHEELVATVILLLLAGHETTANLIGNGFAALVQNRSEFERLRDDPSIEKTAIEELLRYDPPVQMTLRTALDDIALEGHVIEKGRLAVLVIGAANRDPDVFDEPASLDLARNPNPHLAFGGGAHFCIGAPLARLEARIVLSTLLRRFRDVRVERRVRRKSFTIRGFSALEITWS